MNIFMDESGELGFNPRSSSHYYIACLCPSKSKLIGRRFKRFHSHLIRQGWPKEIESKASNLFDAKYNPRIPSTFAYKDDPSSAITHFLKGLADQEISINAIINLNP